MTVERPRYSLSNVLSRPVALFIGAHRKFGPEWWLLIVGALIVMFVIYLALFPGTVAPYDPLDQDAGPLNAIAFQGG